MLRRIHLDVIATDYSRLFYLIGIGVPHIIQVIVNSPEREVSGGLSCRVQILRPDRNRRAAWQRRVL